MTLGNPFMTTLTIFDKNSRISKRFYGSMLKIEVLFNISRDMRNNAT